MSLILDALKKAQKEPQAAGGKNTQLPNPIIPGRPPSSKRFALLIGLLVISLGALFYLRYFKKAPPGFIPKPIEISVDGNSQNPTQLKAKAAQLFQENKLAESQALWERLTLLLPTDAEIYNNLGLVLKKMGKKEAAYDAYTRALALKQDYPEAINNLGVLFLSDNDMGKAKTHFEKAIRLTKDYADPHFNIALIFEREGNIKQASEEYRQFLSLSTNTNEELKKKIQAKIEQLERP